MSQFRVHYQHRGAVVSTVIAGETPQMARSAFQLHYGKTTQIERVEPVGAPAPTPMPRRPVRPAADSVDDRRRVSEPVMKEVANALRGLRQYIAKEVHAPAAPVVTCPECGGPAERLWGQHRGWRVQPLGCGHPAVHPDTPEISERRQAALAAVAALGSARPLEDSAKPNS